MLGMGMPGMPLGYVLGYWPGGYCPGGYWPGGYWPPFGYWFGGYCPGGYCPPVGYCAEASTPHRRMAAAATTAGRKGRRIMGMPPGSILYRSDTVPADIAHQSGTARRQARRTEEWRPRQLPPDGKGAASWECLLEAFYTDR